MENGVIDALANKLIEVDAVDNGSFEFSNVEFVQESWYFRPR